MNVKKCSDCLEAALVLALTGDVDGAGRLYSSTADKIDRFAFNPKNYPDYHRWTPFENEARERRAAVADDLRRWCDYVVRACRAIERETSTLKPVK